MLLPVLLSPTAQNWGRCAHTCARTGSSTILRGTWVMRARELSLASSSVSFFPSILPYFPLSYHCSTRSRKESLSSDQLIGNATQSILINLLANLALKLLRSHVRWRAFYISKLFDTHSREDRSDAKVRKKGVPLSIEKNIFRFEITMDNIPLMSIRKGISHLRQDSKDLTRRQQTCFVEQLT